MFDQFFKAPAFNAKPVVDAVEIQTATATKLVEQQAAFVTELLSAGLENTKALADMKDVKDVVESQQGFARDLGQKAVEAAQLQFAVMNEAREELQKLAQDNLAAVAPAPAAAAAPKASRKRAAAA